MGAPRQCIWEEADLPRAQEAVHSSKAVVVVLGAGASTSSGIPDFRSANGIYSMAGSVQGPPEDVFVADLFLANPGARYDLLDSIFGIRRGRVPSRGGGGGGGIGGGGGGGSGGRGGGGGRGTAGAWQNPHVPTPTHRFLKWLQDRGALLRVYTQNIDSLEEAAGVDTERVVYCHGSLARLRCRQCQEAREWEEAVWRPPPPAEGTPAGEVGGKRTREERGTSETGAGGHIPTCSGCTGTLLPDMVFFGDPLPARVGSQLREDKSAADLLIVIGTSMSVAPLNSVVDYLGAVPQVAINRERLPHAFDCQLLGDSDAITTALCLPGGAAEPAPAHTPVPPNLCLWPGGVLEPSSQGSEGEAPVYDYCCDACGGSIEGPRWSCCDCFEFDLCGGCYGGGKAGSKGMRAHKKAVGGALASGHTFRCE